MKPFVENRKILYVDDEANLLSSFVSLMRKERFEILALQDSARIDAVLNEQGPFALVLSDQRMPALDGVQVLDAVRQSSSESIRVLVTGYADQNDTIKAINIGGIHSYVPKPWNDGELRRMVQEWVSQYNLKTQNSWLIQSLDEENEKLNELLNGTVAQTVRVLGDIVSNIALPVAALGSRVKKLGDAFLRMAPEIRDEEKWEIQRALELFHLGIALLPAWVQAGIATNGLSGLSRSNVAHNHQLLAAGVLRSIPRFAPVARIIELQAKDYDGVGEPANIFVKGEEIPFGARLLHILIDLVNQNPGSSNGADLLREMARNPLKYDVSIIQRMRGGPRVEAQNDEEKLLKISALRIGMVLLEDITTLTGQQLLRSNSTLTETTINILLQWYKNEPIKEPVKVRDQCGLCGPEFG